MLLKHCHTIVHLIFVFIKIVFFSKFCISRRNFLNVGLVKIIRIVWSLQLFYFLILHDFLGHFLIFITLPLISSIFNFNFAINHLFDLLFYISLSFKSFFSKFITSQNFVFLDIFPPIFALFKTKNIDFYSNYKI